MSTFSKGDRVKYVATDPMVNTPELEGATGSVSHAEFDNVEVDWDQAGLPDRGVLPANLRPIATEPEDATDAYVEPEPLKEGDWVRVWAQVDRTRLDSDGDLVITTPGALGEPVDTAYIRPDAIVRPDAGQVPPWVKPARCTSLYEHDGVLVRCTGTPPSGECPTHGAPFSPRALIWDNAHEYGRVEVRA